MRKIKTILIFVVFVLLASAATIFATDNSDEDWLTFNNTYSSERFSPLAQINANNVAVLQPRCTFELGEVANMQTGPIVVGGKMFLTTDMNTYAIEADNCKLLWKHHYEYTSGIGSLKVNRGAAYFDGRVFRGVGDGHVFALDAKTGKLLWKTQAGDQSKGESFPAAPLAWNGLVYIGNAGGDNYGVTGRMMAFDARDGHQVWKFDLVPSDGATAETWQPLSSTAPRTGGATWTSYTIDTAASTLYVSAGNAAPDFVPELRPGKNLYSNSVVALDAQTGKLKTYYQLLPGDFHDWDVASPPALIKTAKGQQLAALAAKDGNLYAIDRATEKIVYKVPTTTIENADAPLTQAGTRFCPGTQGGTEWNGAAFHPRLNTLFVNAIDWCTTIKLVPPDKITAEKGKPYTGTPDDEPFGMFDPQSQWRGWLTAFNAEDGTVRWKYASATPLLAGITTTAGGLVFTGDLAGKFMAFDAATGKILYQYNTNQAIGGGVVSYLAKNKQRIAVASGMTAPIWKTTSTAAKVVVFGLPK